MKIKTLAELSGVSVRTLHHYDQIGLLVPCNRTENGYRDYGQAEIDKLQQILLFRACGFGLSTIQKMFSDPTYSAQEAFDMQKELLLEQRERIDRMLDTLSKTMKARNEGKNMSNKEKFSGFDFRKNPYEQEAMEKWGENTVNKSKQKLDALNEVQQKQLSEELNAIFREFARITGQDPKGAKAQELARKLHQLFLDNIGGFYTKEVMGGLGQMYTVDERFRDNIDQFGEGTANIMSKALEYYSK